MTAYLRLVLIATFLLAWNCGIRADDRIEFNRDIRPILSEYCYHCHGPDNRTRQADLRLDTPDGLLAPSLIVRGEPNESELLKRIVTTDAESRMPPAGSHKELNPSQIGLLRQWITEGAEYQGHWAFQPLKQADLSSKPQSQSPIDFLIDRQLTNNLLTPNTPADEATLVRRAHFDLIGLPPEPEVVATYIADTAPDKYERLIDSLLQSPHFGERLAMWWLDLVRYADTVGYHGDQNMSVWPYRDYVIDAFNRNVPFDQFTIEQLAGDLLPEPTRNQKIASGYNRLGMMSAEGGVQDKEYLAKYIAERVRNVSGTWLGLTFGCCECHNHKFDPFTAKEFYQLESFFADIKERGLYSGADQDGKWGPFIQVPTAEQESAMSDLNSQIAAAESELTQDSPDLDSAQRDWEQQSSQRWTTLLPESVASSNGTQLTIQNDGVVLAAGPTPDTDTYTISFNAIPSGTTALRLEVLPDESLPKHGPGRAGNGNFVLSEFVAEIVDSSSPAVDTTTGDSSAKPTTLAFAGAAASYEQTGAAGGNPYGRWAVAAAIDQDSQGAKWGWAIMEQVGRPHSAVFQLKPDQTASLSDGQQLRIQLRQNLDNPKHTIGRFRLSATTAIQAAQALVLPFDIGEIVQVPDESRTPEQLSKLRSYFRSIASELEAVRTRLAELKRAKAELDKQIAITLVTETVAPRTIRVLPRGNWMDESGEEVQPAFPATIQLASYQPRSQRLTRLDLAQWIVAKDNPLTARVLANRLWKIYFGAGLVRKLDDMGAQGDPPSHPELLDELAWQLIQSGWDIKQLIRSMVTSQAYQRSSHATAEQLAADPSNKWLARQGKFRLDAELVRDNALAVSGLLKLDVGGRSVKPYQPPGYWAYLNFPTREWANGTGDELYRRGMYTHWQRQYLHPSLMAFDAPNREECTADRPRSNTPLQSLALLNDPTYVEAARAFAGRLLEDPQALDDAQRINAAMRRALSRAPTAAETELLLSVLKNARDEYQNNSQSVEELLTVGVLPVAPSIDRYELAAWTTVARVILNLHETLTRF